MPVIARRYRGVVKMLRGHDPRLRGVLTMRMIPMYIERYSQQFQVAMSAHERMPRAPVPSVTKAENVRTLDSRELLGSCQEIVIVHQGQRYRLRLTRQNKLILTK